MHDPRWDAPHTRQLDGLGEELHLGLETPNILHRATNTNILVSNIESRSSIIAPTHQLEGLLIKVGRKSLKVKVMADRKRTEKMSGRNAFIALRIMIQLKFRWLPQKQHDGFTGIAKPCSTRTGENTPAPLAFRTLPSRQ